MVRCMSAAPKNPHAQALGRLGGSKNTPSQNKARKANARKGGWPKGRPRKIVGEVKPDIWDKYDH